MWARVVRIIKSFFRALVEKLFITSTHKPTKRQRNRNRPRHRPVDDDSRLHNDEKASVNELLNFSSIKPIVKDPKYGRIDNNRKASFSVVFAKSGKPATITFDRDPSWLAWRNYNQKGFFSEFKIIESNTQNKYECTLPPKFNPWSMKITCETPDDYERTAQVQEEYSKKFLIYETRELYETITRLHLESHRSDIAWIMNILQGKKGTENIIYMSVDEENGFVMLQNSKWDGSSITKMQYLVIPRKRINSLRDLNQTHLPLLKHIQDIGISKMMEKHNLQPTKFRIYVHYPPTYNYLHVHFSFLDFRRIGEHLLPTIIDNIEMVSDYYQKAKLSFVLKTDEPLGGEYREKGMI